MRGSLRFVALPLLVLVAGFVLPRLLIPDGLSKFEGDDRYRAESALEGVRNEAWSDNDPAPKDLFRAILTTAYRVEEVGPCKGWPAEEPREPPPVYYPPLTPKNEEEVIREEMGPEFRDVPLYLLTENTHHEVRLYTVFGIPYATDALTCDERR